MYTLIKCWNCETEFETSPKFGIIDATNFDPKSFCPVCDAFNTAISVRTVVEAGDRVSVDIDYRRGLLIPLLSVLLFMMSCSVFKNDVAERDNIVIQTTTKQQIVISFKDLSAEMTVADDTLIEERFAELRKSVKQFKSFHKSIVFFDLYIRTPYNVYYQNYSFGKLKKLK